MLGLTLVRHAPTRFNEARRYQGWKDLPLSLRGEKRAQEIGDRIRALGPDPERVVASDLARARATARLAFPAARLSVDTRLREMSFGAYEGYTYDENRARHGDSFVQWVLRPDAHTPPGGESLSEFQARVGAWLGDLPPDGDLVVVTHGGVLRLVAARLASVPFPPGILGHVPPGSLIRSTLHDPAEPR